MSDTPGAGAVLDDRPELRDATAAVLAVDDEQDGWTFDDIPIDSGQFGELVSAGIVEKDGDEYRVADPNAVRAALDGKSGVGSDSESGTLSVTRCGLISMRGQLACSSLL